MYINIYNNLINLTRNKKLYLSLQRKDNFSDRLVFFLLHFSFFLKNFKKVGEKKLLQDIYDYIFKQLELSIREIGYGDQSINKKMKIYINHFYRMLSDVHFWNDLSIQKKRNFLENYLSEFKKLDDIIEYFDDFDSNLSKNTLINFSKGVIKS